MPKLRNGNNGDSNPGSLDCESGILPTELPRSTEKWRHLDRAKQTRVEPIVLYGCAGVSSYCRGDDTTQNASRPSGVIMTEC